MPVRRRFFGLLALLLVALAPPRIAGAQEAATVTRLQGVAMAV